MLFNKRKLFSLLFLAVLLLSTSYQMKEEEELVKLKFDIKGQVAELSVQSSGTDFDWKADNLAVATWWDADSVEVSQAVSPSAGWKIKQKKTDQGYRLECRQPDMGFSFPMIFTTNADILTVSVASSEITETGMARLKKLRLLPRFGAAKDGDEGYLVTAKGAGTLCYFKNKKSAEKLIPVYNYYDNTMPLFGLVRDNSAMAGIVTSGQYDLGFCVSTNWGLKNHYSIDPVFTLRSFVKETLMPDDLTVQYHFLQSEEADWIGIGKRYRKYNFEHRGIHPLRRRVAESPELAYSANAMEVRMRLGVKSVPCQIVDQTPENEPPMRVYLTFNRVREIIDEFHRQGIDKAEICLVGWNIGGHDGRYPQLFPIEPLLGGEAELRKTISYAQSLGFQMISHNNHYDAFKISEDWDEEYIRKKPDGQLFKGGLWGGGQSYNICLTRAYELFAQRDLPKIKELGFKGVHYVDVLTTIGLRPCYDPRHPETRRQDAEAINRILALSREIFGGVQSEGALDFSAPVLDRAYSVQNKAESALLKESYVDVCIPLYPCVYHGVLLYNSSQKSINSLPGEIDYLKNIEYGGLPLFYLYKNFRDIPNSKNTTRDFRYNNKKDFKEIVAGLKCVYDDLQILKHLQMEFIEGHNQLADGIFETVYSNGERVVVNYNDTPFLVASGEEIPAKGFKLISKSN